MHATVDLGGQTRFGPDVEWVEDPGMSVFGGEGAGGLEVVGWMVGWLVG